MLKSMLLAFIRQTKPLVWRLAEAYDIRVDRPCTAYGRNPLVLEDEPECARRNIPKSVRFNSSSGTIFVGRNTVFGEEVAVLTGKHLNIEESRRRGVDLFHVPQGRDIKIGRGCYIGGRAILIGPLTVGDFSVIGAGSVVTNDVPAGTFVAGNPARIVRSLQST